MTRYSFVIEATISMHTDVEAESLEEAIEEAKCHPMQGLCHQCAHGAPDREWVTSGELDAESASSELVDLYGDGELVVISDAVRKAWGDR